MRTDFITDGAENSSKEFRDARAVKTLLEDAQKNDWQVVFLGSGIDVSQEGAHLGIKANLTRSNVKGGEFMAQEVACAVSNYRSAAVGSAAYSRGLSFDGNDNVSAPDDGEEDD